MSFITSILHFKIVFKNIKCFSFSLMWLHMISLAQIYLKLSSAKCAFLTFWGAFLYSVCLLQKPYGKVVKKKKQVLCLLIDYYYEHFTLNKLRVTLSYLPYFLPLCIFFFFFLLFLGYSRFSKLA